MREIQKVLQQYSRSILVWVLFSCVLFFLLDLNFLKVLYNFGLGSNLPISTEIGSDSYLVLNRLAVAKSSTTNFFTPLYMDQIYTSQFGLQGILLSAIRRFYPGIGTLPFALASSHMFCLITSMVLGAFYTSIYYRIGRTTAIVALILTGLSPWVAKFSTSLYWAAFFLFAPFIFCWIVYPFVLQKPKLKLLFYSGIAVLVMAKSLCGYEYITSLLLSPVAAVIFHHVRHNDRRRKDLLFDVAAVIASGLVGFLLAIGIHIIQLTYFLGSDGARVIFERAGARTVLAVPPDQKQFIDNFMANLDEHPIAAFLIKRHWLSPDLIFGINSFFRYFSFPAIDFSWLFKREAHITIGLLTLLSIATLGLLRLRTTRTDTTLSALILASNFGIISALSWQVLAFNHMSIHFHLNGIVFYLPFLLVFYVLVGYIAESLANRFVSSSIRSASIYFLTSFLIVSLLTVSIQELVKQQSFHIVDQGNYYYANSSLSDRKPKTITGNVETMEISDLSSSVTYEILRSRLSPQVKTLKITGWAADLKYPTDPVEVFVVLDGLVIHQQRVSDERSDVEEVLKLSDITPGFQIDLPLLKPESIQPIKKRIRVYAARVVGVGGRLEMTEISRPQ